MAWFLYCRNPVLVISPRPKPIRSLYNQELGHEVMDLGLRVLCFRLFVLGACCLGIELLRFRSQFWN